MDKKQCFLLGYITKPHALGGELVFFLDSDIPENYVGLDAVFVEINNQLVPFFISRIQVRDKGKAIVRLDGIDSFEKVQPLIGKSLYLPLTALPKLEGNKFYFHEVIGYDVTDAEKGSIGKVESFIEQTAQTIMVVKKDDHEILLPISDSIIQKVDRKNSLILVDAPEGLIDLFLEM